MDREKIMQWTREKLKKSFTRDTLVIQSIHTIDELTKIINKLAVNLTERYGWYAPKLAKTEALDELLSFVLAKKKDELGVELREEDLQAIIKIAEEIKKLEKLKEVEEIYLAEVMEEVCPRLKEVATALIGARLVNLAGSLKHLAEIPSSTIQVLGAEKALFRHIRTGAKAPKFGVIFAHPDVTGAESEKRGKKARQLASKISIVVKQDYFRQ